MGPKRVSDVFPASKPKSEEVPVVVCQGWFDACEFCDKRFCEWTPVDDDVWLKIPSQPGALMVALKDKVTCEVVSILLDDSSLQKATGQCIDAIREQKSNKKSKATKSALLVRWTTFKKMDDKEAMILCAHWCNNGVLPKFLTQFPGVERLEVCGYFVFSKNLQKWCHPRKDPVWRKANAPSRKIVEIVKKCDWFGPCEICDTLFGKWRSVSSALANDSIPDELGVFMISVAYEKKREVVYLSCNRYKSFAVNLKETLKQDNRHLFNVAKDEKFVAKNPSVDVRWMLMKGMSSDDSCFLLAHWSNVGKLPMLDGWFCGEDILGKNKLFANRGSDKKWYMITDAWKTLKLTKVKDKKALIESIEDDCLELGY